MGQLNYDQNINFHSMGYTYNHSFIGTRGTSDAIILWDKGYDRGCPNNRMIVGNTHEFGDRREGKPDLLLMVKNSQINAQTLPRDAHGGSFKVATYNVHRSIGIDGVRDLERTARVIKETGAHIIALQEVEELLEDPHTLASLTGMTAISGMTLETADRRFGNILLTDFEIRSAEVVDISWGRREPRSIIDVMIETPGGEPLRCLATHLGLSSRERKHQHRLIAALLSKHWEGPTLLMGDLNEWRPYAPALRRIDRLLGPSLGRRSFPSRLPLLPLDRIWISPNRMLQSVAAHRTPISQAASDHLPVVADLELQ